MQQASGSSLSSPLVAWWPGLRVQFRVIGALLLREVLTRYGRHNIGFLWLLVEPMLFTGLIAWAYSSARAAGVQTVIPIAAFAVTGYSCVMLWRNMPARCMGAVTPNRALLFHRPVKLLDVYFARIILEATGATMSFVALALLGIALGWMPWPQDLLAVCLAWMLLAWFGLSLGLLLGPLSERSKWVEKIWAPLSYLLFPLSGTFYLVSSLPPQAQEFVLLLPMVHAVEMLREGYFGHLFAARYSVVYLVSWNMALMLLGLSQVRLVARTGVRL